MLRFVAVLLVLVLPLKAHAWGAIGHRTVAVVAEAQLTEPARALVHDLLGPQSLPDVANWADSLRSSDGYKQTIWYHFEKIPDGITLLDNLRAMPDWQKKKGGVVSAILLADRILRDPARRAEQPDALKFLVHFTGDLHQPLHTGRPEDNGGVKLGITWMGHPMSLHHLWDSGLIDTGHPEFARGQGEADAAKAYAAWLLTNPPKQLATAFDVEGWLNESLSLRGGAYDTLYSSDPQRYQSQHLPEVDQRLYAAGLRLAALLNSIAAHEPTPAQELALVRQIEAVIGPLEQTVNFHP